MGAPTHAGHVTMDAAHHTPPSLAPWETLAVEAVGNVIEFWGFKRNQGRLWGILYLRGRPFTPREICDALGLSKGAVSMLLRDLEYWSVVRKVRRAGDANWTYEANTDFREMISRVLEVREAEFLRRVKADLAQAERLLAQEKSVPAEVADRLRRMSVLARRVDEAVSVFRATAQLDVRSFIDALRTSVRERFNPQHGF